MNLPLIIKDSDGEIIEPGSKFGMTIGFDSKLFHGYLWRKGNEIWISLIYSLRPDCGNVSALIKNIISKGYDVCIPTPLGKMKDMVIKNDYQHEVHNHEHLGKVNVWRKKGESS